MVLSRSRLHVDYSSRFSTDVAGLESFATHTFTTDHREIPLLQAITQSVCDIEVIDRTVTQAEVPCANSRNLPHNPQHVSCLIANEELDLRDAVSIGKQTD